MVVFEDIVEEVGVDLDDQLGVFVRVDALEHAQEFLLGLHQVSFLMQLLELAQGKLTVKLTK